MSTPKLSNDTGTEHPNSAPFFTVLIPTANRPQLLPSAIESVLWQTFSNFELVVSDNSSDEMAARQNGAMIARHSKDCRIRYIRPPAALNMPDHWEFASRHARGRYVVILTDRHVMRPGALARLVKEITRREDDTAVILWRCDSTYETSGIVYHRDYSGNVRVSDSNEVVVGYAKMDDWRTSLSWINQLPRSLNSCYRSDIARTIRAKHGRLFRPLYPDYTSAFLLLAYTNRVTYIDCPLFLNHGTQSNGRKYLIYGDQEYISSLGDVDLFAGTPTRLRTVTNAIVRDLMMVKELVGTIYANVDIGLVGYFMHNYKEMMHMERLGSVVNVGRLYTQWWRAVRALPADQTKQIENHVVELEQKRVRFTRLRRVMVRWGVDGRYHRIAATIRRLSARSDVHRYATVLDAAKQTDSLLTLEHPV